MLKILLAAICFLALFTYNPQEAQAQTICLDPTGSQLPGNPGVPTLNAFAIAFFPPQLLPVCGAGAGQQSVYNTATNAPTFVSTNNGNAQFRFRVYLPDNAPISSVSQPALFVPEGVNGTGGNPSTIPQSHSITGCTSSPAPGGANLQVSLAVGATCQFTYSVEYERNDGGTITYPIIQLSGTLSHPNTTDGYLITGGQMCGLYFGACAPTVSPQIQVSMQNGTGVVTNGGAPDSTIGTNFGGHVVNSAIVQDFVEITNLGPGSLEIASIASLTGPDFSTNDPAQAPFDSYPIIIPEGDSILYPVYYAPTSSPSSSMDSILIVSNATNEPSFTVNLAAQTNDATDYTTTIINNFMADRSDLLTANSPDLVSRIVRGRFGPGGAYSFAGAGTSKDNFDVNFSTSLRSAAGPKEAMQGQNDLGFDAWIEASLARSHSETRDNDNTVVYAGIDYKFNDNLVVGLMGQYDWLDQNDAEQNFSISGHGWMVGPYIVARLHENLLFDARLAYGLSDNEISPFNTYVDNFKTERFLAQAQLTGSFAFDEWNFSPQLDVIYYSDQQEDYIDSLGNLIPQQTVALGRLSFGPRISRNWVLENGVVLSPHLGLQGLWNFATAERYDLITSEVSLGGTSDALRARLNGGITIGLNNGMALTGEGFFDGIGVENYRAYGGNLRLNIPL